MKNSILRKLSNSAEKILIFAASFLFIYFLCSLYFINHFFFHTEINEVDVSLKAHSDADRIIRGYINDYELVLIQRNGSFERISGHDIGLQLNNKVSSVSLKQKPFQWIISLFKHQKYDKRDMFSIDVSKFNHKINTLKCLNQNIIEPKNVSFTYGNGTYEIIKEEYGNKVNKEQLYKAIEMAVLGGRRELNLDRYSCYENPKYTLESEKAMITKDLLNRYVSTKIIYNFGDKKEILDGNVICKWLEVDDNLDVVINAINVDNYIKELSKQYNTVGIARNFKTSSGKILEVKGGLYGWKINITSERNALIENIEQGEVLEREPVYAQKALSHSENDIGNTYVEINITKQHLWFYKEGKLLTQGYVVTGNPNKGNATVLGTYMVNYKENGSTLSGVNYNVRVSYWMPFYGNIGIHDAKWRHSFGGEIYKRNGTHGCVNAPFYLAKTIFENIEEGTPVICYEE
jgi:hypothetical protein